MARRSKRSKAASKGWETRRQRAAEAAARTAKRSAAAKRGWAARKGKTVVPLTARERRQIDAQRELARKEQARLKQAVSREVRRPEKIPPYDPDDYDEDDVELAELWHVHPADVEAYRETLGIADWADPTSDAWDYGKTADYIADFAEELHVDENDIWEIWWQGVYGGSPQAVYREYD